MILQTNTDLPDTLKPIIGSGWYYNKYWPAWYTEAYHWIRMILQTNTDLPDTLKPIIGSGGYYKQILTCLIHWSLSLDQEDTTNKYWPAWYIEAYYWVRMILQTNTDLPDTLKPIIASGWYYKQILTCLIHWSLSLHQDDTTNKYWPAWYTEAYHWIRIILQINTDLPDSLKPIFGSGWYYKQILTCLIHWSLSLHQDDTTNKYWPAWYIEAYHCIRMILQTNTDLPDTLKPIIGSRWYHNKYWPAWYIEAYH